ncbi:MULTISPECIES: hypothetical protein [Streptomyces]|uniref:Uncharacterized protein n=2 Tax=Streptomyces TaxID=1883 RepID=A0A2U9P0V2_STRAS|nr:hypothetical protein [Streptomyces actuosus]AWT42821.1 hypothetical protein DMT42_11130 [Streptomyces actuosus]MBM4820052.1 hypothetical protein [Streptomyces actuosus]MBM4825066.1 hypothetical protein [Streptomyces actuosus]
MEGWKFWWGIAAFFLGGLATQLNGWLTYRRQRKDRADDAADALRQRREEFELQHLVEVHQLLRSVMTHVLSSRVLAWNLADGVGGELMEESYTEARRAYQEAMDGLVSQVGFVFDDEVRGKVGEAAARLAWAFDRHRREDRTQEVLSTGEVVNEAYAALTARVRALYAGRAGS